MGLIDTKSNQDYGMFYIKLGLLLFFCFWFLIAFLTNCIDFYIASGLMKTLHFHSGNYSALKSVVSIYNTPNYILNLLFLADILMQGASAMLFLVATFCFWRDIYLWQSINMAFGFSMALWVIFIIMEEIFIAYSYEATHIRLLILEMTSLLALHLLPHKSRST